VSACLSDCLREVAALPAGGELTHAQKLARVLWRKALAGDVRAAALVADRLEGKPGQAVKLTADGQPVTSYTVVGFGQEVPVTFADAVRQARDGKPE
jgi:hypothetical protein